MITSVIHAGGKGTRLRESFNGPKALAPVDGRSLLWYHIRPLIESRQVSNFLFTLMYEPQLLIDHIDQLAEESDINTSIIIEPRPLGRAGSVRYAIENGLIDINQPLLMSHPDDLIPINIKRLVEYAEESNNKGISLILVMAKKTVNPFGIGITMQNNGIIKLESFLEKPELPLIPNHYANTGMALYMPAALEHFKSAPLDKKTHPEDYIIPRLVKEHKVGVYLIERWLSINYASDYEKVQKMGYEGVLDYLHYLANA